MSKELDALNRLKGTLLNEGYWQDILQDVAIIETALKDYEKKTKLAKEYANVNNVAKRLKALEIIKEKIYPLLDFDIVLNTSIKERKFTLANNLDDNTFYLTQKEYDLLKEVLL